MRTNRILAAALLAAAALTACYKESGGTQPDGRTPVRFAADIERSATPATRAAGTAWEADDAIGIFMVENGSTTDIVGGAENRQYTTATTAGEFTPASGNEIFYPTNGSVDFIAYYPHKSGATLGTALPVTIGDQNDQPLFDLLYSDNATDFSKSSTDAVGLTFRHMLSKFVIKPIAGTDVEDEELAAMTVRIEGMNTAATFDLATGALGTPGTVADITPRTVTAGSVYDAIVLPADYEAGEVKVYFTIDGDTFTWTLGAESFTGGNEYSYTVTLSRTAVGTDVAVTGDINPWETNPHDPVTVTPDEEIDDVLAEIKDDNFRAAVTTLMTDEGWDANTDGKLSRAEAAAVTGTMDVSNKSIASLAGIEYFTGLTGLYCGSNDLTALDVSNNTALTRLYCHNNDLDALDVSKNTALTRLNCHNNNLDALDVSANTALTNLDCYGNVLETLDVSALTALKSLYCHYNDLTALDVTKNTALDYLDCSGNALDALDVSKNTALTELWCQNNALTTLDVSKNTALTVLYCGDGSTELTVTVDAEAHNISTNGNLEVRASNGSGGTTTRITALNTETNGVTVTAGGTTGYDPAVQNYRITWKDGKYAITTDPTDAGLYFKFGSVAGIFSGDGTNQTLPAKTNDAFDASDVAWSPVVVNDNWASVPYSTYDDTNVTVDAAYHTAANVKAGKGDPCRLVGLDLDAIKNADDASELTAAQIDNGQWRLPTNAENQIFSGYNAYINTAAHWTTSSSVNGGMFPDKTSGSKATFLPAAGARNTSGTVFNQGTEGRFWTSVPVSASFGYNLLFSSSYVRPVSSNEYALGFAVRCVRQ